MSSTDQGIADTGAVKLAWERFGHPGQPAVVLIMGLGAQCIVWPEDWCQSLAQAGYQVIRFDNRDIGRSTLLQDAGSPQLVAMALRQRLGLSARAAYTLHDMARDVIGLLDSLNIPAAHIVGASMGGMIGQIMAVRHYRRVLSLTSIMSNSGENLLLRGNPARLLRVARSFRPLPGEDPVRQRIRLLQVLSADPKADETLLRERALASLQRAENCPVGIKRQLAAILATGCRRDQLARIKLPVLVIHGTRDPLIPPHSGLRSARYMRQSRVALIEDMGHDLPPRALPQIRELLLSHWQQSRSGFRSLTPQAALWL